MAGSFAPVMYWAVGTTLCSALRSEAEQLPYQAVIPGSDATSQDALGVAAVEPFVDLKTHAKYLQSPEGEYGLFTTALVFLDHVSLLVMWKPRNLKLSTCSTTARSSFSCSPQ